MCMEARQVHLGQFLGRYPILATLLWLIEFPAEDAVRGWRYRKAMIRNLQLEEADSFCRVGDVKTPLPSRRYLSQLCGHLGATLEGVHGWPIRDNMLDVRLRQFSVRS